MDKPRAFIHFESRYNMELGLLAIGKRYVPVAVILSGTFFLAGVFTILSWILVMTTLNPVWWWVIAGYGIFAGSLLILSGVVALIAWMVRSTRAVNSR